MADYENVVNNAEDMTDILKRTAAEYESAAASMERLTEEARREIQRYEELMDNEDLKLDWAVDLFMEASELRLAMLDCGMELDDACNEILGYNIDLSDLSTYPGDFQVAVGEMSPEDQELVRTDLAKFAKEADAAGPVAGKPKRRPRRMSV